VTFQYPCGCKLPPALAPPLLQIPSKMSSDPLNNTCAPPSLPTHNSITATLQYVGKSFPHTTASLQHCSMWESPLRGSFWCLTPVVQPQGNWKVARGRLLPATPLVTFQCPGDCKLHPPLALFSPLQIPSITSSDPQNNTCAPPLPSHTQQHHCNTAVCENVL